MDNCKLKCTDTFVLRSRDVLVIVCDILSGKVSKGDSVILDGVPVYIVGVEFVDKIDGTAQIGVCVNNSVVLSQLNLKNLELDVERARK